MRSLADNELSARQDEQLEKIEEIEVQKDHLTTREAHKIACERGFTGDPKALSDRVNKSPDQIRQKYGLIRITGGKNAQWKDVNSIE